MKLSINKLIANDIINYGMDQIMEMEDGNGANYIVSLDTYLKDFDEDTKKYILENVDKIIEDIQENENVLDLEVSKEDNNIDFNMIFYWENLLTEVEKSIDSTAKILGVEMDLKDIKQMSADILDDDEFNDDLINRLKYFGNEHEQELN